jgi:hypothetical protein
MNNLLLIALLIFISTESKSQSVIGSTGGEGNVGNMNINYTVGEAATITITNDSTTLTQGFHQPTYVITAIAESFLPGAVTVYPNPTKSILQIQFEGIDLTNLSISLHDSTGRGISKSIVGTSIWQTDLSQLTNGMYILTVTDTNNNKINSYKIFKTN